MKPIVVSDVLAIGEMPSLEQIAILAKAGFRSIINNQPDGEVERFPASNIVAEEAKRCGLGHAYAPVASRMPSAHELAHFARALAELPSPIYAFCYSGSRSAAACAMTMTAEKDVDTIVAEFAAAGFDVAALRPWLDDERNRRAPDKRSVGIATSANGSDGANSKIARNIVSEAQQQQKPVQVAIPAVAGAAMVLSASPPVAPVTSEPPAIAVAATEGPVPAQKPPLQGIIVHARPRGASGFAI